jgi:hypothetical protein
MYAPEAMKRQCAVLMIAALSIAGTANAQQRDASRYSRMLLPFHQSVRTAEGTWNVTWWIRNDGDVALDIFPVALGGGLPPPPEFRDFVFVARYPAARPRSTLKSYAGDALPSPFIPAFVPVKTNGVGAFVYVEDSGKVNLAFGGTLAWRALGWQPPPFTPLRAVPERAFLSGRHSIVSVPSVAAARYDLRVYALAESVTTTGVTIRIYDTQAAVLSPDDQLIRTLTGNFESPSVSLAPCFSPCDVPTNSLAPASLQVINVFEPPGDPQFRGPQTFRIEIEPDSPDVRWWAIVSTMDHATRQVTLYQPSF